MPIASTDILYKLSGGGANTDVNASLGGAMSSTTLTDSALNNLFDDVSGDESAAGDVEYRCIYLQNNHGTLTWEAVVAWISQQTPSVDTVIAIGLDPAGAGGTAATIANESTAPAGVSFSSPTSKGSGLIIGDLAPGAYIAIWLRRTTTAGAAAAGSDNVVLSTEGDTAQ